MCQQINSELQLPAIRDWLCSNNLTLNLSKTKYLVFHPSQKINCNLYPPLKLADDQYLEPSHNIRYLALVTDCFLSWHDHIDYIRRKISKSVNIIAKLKRHVTTLSLKYESREGTSDFRLHKLQDFRLKTGT